MKFGGAMFFTEYSMTAPELAVALEERGYDSVGHPSTRIFRSRAKRRSQAAANCPSNMPTRWTHSWFSRPPECDQNDQARHRRAARAATRHDPDRETRGLHRSGQPGPLPVRHRRRLESGRDGEPRNGVQKPFQAGAREHRGDEGDLDQAEGRVSRRVRQFRSDDGVAEAGAETTSAHPCRRGLPARRPARDPLR